MQDEDAVDTPPVRSRPPPPTRRGLGWRKNLPDPRDYSARARFGAPLRLPGEVTDIEPFVRGILDQGATSSCVPHAFSEAVDTRLRKLGYDPPKPSVLALYAPTRGVELASPDDPLVDQGSFPRDCASALSTYGLAADADWPWDESKVNDRPPWDVAQKASAFRVSAYYRIDTFGMSRAQDVANALAHGYPVVFGTQVGRAFEQYSGQGAVQLPGSQAESLGGHMLCLVGYATDNGEIVFRGQNSWGDGWGDRGFFWLRASSIALPDESVAGDFTVLEVAGG